MDNKNQYGLNKDTTSKMIAALRREYRRCRKCKGRNYKFGPDKMFDIFMCRFRYNDTFQRIANRFGISKSTACRLFKRVLKIMRIMPEFKMSDASNLPPNRYTVDTTPIKVQRSKCYEKRKAQYNGNYHIFCSKVQIIVVEHSMIPECVTFEEFGSVNDFKIFKDIAPRFQEGVTFSADSGYQGIDKLIPGSESPRKKSKHHPLTEEDTQSNHELAVKRIYIEHANAYIKRFAIIGETFRGNTSQLKDIVMLICGVCRYELISTLVYALIFAEQLYIYYGH